MALPAYSSKGTASTTLTIAHPATVNAGEMLLLFRVIKYPDVSTPDTPSGWTLLGTVTGGAGASGADSGNVSVTAYSKVADGTEGGTNLTVTNTGVANCQIGQITNYTRASTSTWKVLFTSGSDNTKHTAESVTGTADPGFLVNDLMVVCYGGNINLAASSEAFAAGTVTFGAVTERNDTQNSGGDHCDQQTSTGAITAVTASGAPTYTATSGAGGSAGAAVFVVLREITNTGTGSSTLAAATLTGTGQELVQGTESSTLGAITVTASGLVTGTGGSIVAGVPRATMMTRTCMTHTLLAGKLLRNRSAVP